MTVVSALLHALQLALFMFWEVLWPLALGFLLSALVQSVISRRAIERSLGSDSLASAALATGLGAASSSCSYAAVAVARSLFTRGASFANSIVFEFASTNLVFELGLVLLILLGWPFVGAQFAGGVLMVVILLAIFRLTLRKPLLQSARAQAERRVRGRMEGHGEMDMAVTEGPLLRRVFSARGLTAISHYFWMDVYSLWQDLLLGFLIAGALAAWVPNSFWHAFFLTDNAAAARIWGPLVGPIIAMLSFVCSVGNVPLAAVLWNGGISFGGVISFIFADLLILPILNIYRKYYGLRMMVYLTAASYIAMVLSGFVVDAIFEAFRWAPAHFTVEVFESTPQLNYTTVLDLVFLALSVLLGWRFLRTGGVEMLRMRDEPAHAEMHSHHEHA
jgi:uncharacterized membrane protein YraQ (UPF0718 family)